MSKMTVQERQEKLEMVAAIAPEVLAKTTVKELRQLASGLITGYSGLKSSELLAAITEAVSETRDRLTFENHRKALEALAKTESTEDHTLRAAHKTMYTPRSVEVIAFDIITVLKAIEASADALDVKLRRIDALALHHVDQERQRYSIKTQKNNLTKLREVLGLEVAKHGDTMYFQNLSFAKDRFISSVGSLFRDSMKLIKTEYQLKVATQSRAQVAIDGYGLLQKAESVLRKLEAAEPLEVILALILVTGRRPSELLTTHTKLSVASETTLAFTGQLKARHDLDRKNQSFEIPSLVDAALVVSTFNLVREKLTVLDDPDDINSKYATPLRRALKKYGWSTFYDALKPHDLRKLYATLAISRKPENFTTNGYLATILGHTANDVSTANSYQFFSLKEVNGTT